MTLAKKLRISVITLLIGVLSFYSYHQASAFISGPTLSIDSPALGGTLTERLVTVSGTAKNASIITINGTDTFIDENGRFSEQLLLAPGYTILEVVIVDRFGRSIKETRPVIHTPINE